MFCLCSYMYIFQKYIYLVFVIWNTTCTQSFTAHMLNLSDSGTAISAFGKTAFIGTEKIPS